MLVPEKLATELSESSDQPPTELQQSKSKQPDAGYVPIGPARPQGPGPSIVAFFEHPGIPYNNTMSLSAVLWCHRLFERCASCS